MSIDFADVQGNVMPGFAKPRQAFLFFELRSLPGVREWLSTVVPLVTTQEEVLEFRKRLRLWKAVGTGEQPTATWLNIGFTASGVKKLGYRPERLGSVAFAEGLARRAHLTDGRVDNADRANPGNWLFGGGASPVDLMIHLAADTEEDLLAAVRSTVSETPPSCQLIHLDIGQKLQEALEGKEHFGYRDGVSQPKAIAKVLDGEWGDNIDPSDLFVFLDEVHDDVHTVPWALQSTFGVYKRLEQDVYAFRKACAQAAAEISGSGRGAAISAMDIGARMMGRWPSGAPLSLRPMEDDPKLGLDEARNNDFDYSDDPWGDKCPIDSHVRLAFARGEEVGSGQRRRMVRRGIPFGKPYPSRGDRGLLFLSFQASIERQFEGIWAPDEDIWRRSPGGPSPLLGSTDRPLVFSVRAAGGNSRRVALRLRERFVTNTGGVYLIYPTVAGIGILTNR